MTALAARRRRPQAPLHIPGCQLCLILFLVLVPVVEGVTKYAKLSGDISELEKRTPTKETTITVTSETTTTTTTATTMKTETKRHTKTYLRHSWANSWFPWRKSSSPQVQVETTTQTVQTTTVQPQEERRLSTEPPPVPADQAEPQQQQPQNQPVRPVMHTFYSRVDEEAYSTGMTENADTALLEVWRSSWMAAGFEPRVLTLQDAQKHPQYERYNQILLSPDVAVNEYDRFCFLRWLAMAVSGGGWMADYDVMPLEGRWTEDVQPQQHQQDQWDKMILYAGLPSPKPGAVPCLVRGTAAQWDQMARLLLENTVAHGRSVELWSDFYALIDLSKSGTAAHLFEIQRSVLSGHKGLVVGTRDWTPEQCQEITPAPEINAIHFSHSAINRGKFENTTNYQDRPQVAQTWLNMWSRQCAATDTATTPSEKTA